MSDNHYFPVPLVHFTSPVAYPLDTQEVDEKPPAEPFGMLDVVEPADSYGEDEVTLLARDPFTLFVHWEVTPEARARHGADEEGAALVLRVHVAAGAHAAPAQIIDERLGRMFGRGYLPSPYPGAVIDAAVGVRGRDGGFTPIAASPRLRVPFANPEDGPVEWMEVPPARTRGVRFEPPSPTRHGSAETVPGASRRALPDGQVGAQRPSPGASAIASSTIASSTGASSTGASSTGASSTGASSTGASSTGATSTGATSTGATSPGAPSSRALPSPSRGPGDPR